MFGLLGPMFGLGGGGQNVASLVQKHAPGPGQFHRTGVAFQQTHFKFVFQRFDLPAQRRLGQVQALGGAPEIQLLGHRHKITQVSQFHVII